MGQSERSTLAQPCPHCCAAPGQPCTREGADGLRHPISGYHTLRGRSLMGQSGGRPEPTQVWEREFCSEMRRHLGPRIAQLQERQDRTEGWWAVARRKVQWLCCQGRPR